MKVAHDVRIKRTVQHFRRPGAVCHRHLDKPTGDAAHAGDGFAAGILFDNIFDHVDDCAAIVVDCKRGRAVDDRARDGFVLFADRTAAARRHQLAPHARVVVAVLLVQVLHR